MKWNHFEARIPSKVVPASTNSKVTFCCYLQHLGGVPPPWTQPQLVSKGSRKCNTRKYSFFGRQRAETVAFGGSPNRPKSSPTLPPPPSQEALGYLRETRDAKSAILGVFPSPLALPGEFLGSQRIEIMVLVRGRAALARCDSSSHTPDFKMQQRT